MKTLQIIIEKLSRFKIHVSTKHIFQMTTTLMVYIPYVISLLRFTIKEKKLKLYTDKICIYIRIIYIYIRRKSVYNEYYLKKIIFFIVLTIFINIINIILTIYIR